MGCIVWVWEEKRACFEWLYFGCGGEFRDFPLKLGNVISTSVWKHSVLREVNKGTEQESACRGSLWKQFFLLFWKAMWYELQRKPFQTFSKPGIPAIVLHVIKQLAERLTLIKHCLLVSLVLDQERSSEDQILLENLSPIFPWNCTLRGFKGLCIYTANLSFSFHLLLGVFINIAAFI